MEFNASQTSVVKHRSSSTHLCVVLDTVDGAQGRKAHVWCSGAGWVVEKEGRVCDAGGKKCRAGVDIHVEWASFGKVGGADWRRSQCSSKRVAAKESCHGKRKSQEMEGSEMRRQAGFEERSEGGTKE